MVRDKAKETISSPKKSKNDEETSNNCITGLECPKKMILDFTSKFELKSFRLNFLSLIFDFLSVIILFSYTLFMQTYEA